MRERDVKIVDATRLGRQITITVAEQEQASFFTCLAMGTLYAIKMGVLPPSAGIWTVGRPKISETLADLPATPTELLHTMEVADEFSALSQLAPDKLQLLLERLLLDMGNSLQRMPNPMWDIDLEISND